MSYLFCENLKFAIQGKVIYFSLGNVDELILIINIIEGERDIMRMHKCAKNN